jgi:general secretion pathway protein G
MKRSAFTMVELVFVIVVLGILAAIAVPRLAASREDAQIVKGKADISAIRSSIAIRRSQNLLSGDAKFPELNGTTGLFGGVLDYPIKEGSSGWNMVGTDAKKYTFKAENTEVTFEYDKDDKGTFTCVGVAENSGIDKEKLCTTLTQ